MYINGKIISATIGTITLSCEGIHIIRLKNRHANIPKKWLEKGILQLHQSVRHLKDYSKLINTERTFLVDVDPLGILIITDSFASGSREEYMEAMSKIAESYC